MRSFVMSAAFAGVSAVASSSAPAPTRDLVLIQRLLRFGPFGPGCSLLRGSGEVHATRAPFGQNGAPESPRLRARTSRKKSATFRPHAVSLRIISSEKSATFRDDAVP